MARERADERARVAARVAAGRRQPRARAGARRRRPERRSSRGSGRPRPGASRCSAGSASPASTTWASASTRHGTRRSASSPPPPPAGHGGAGRAARLRRRRAQLRPAAVVVATGRGLMADAGDFYEVLGVSRDARRRRDPAGVPQAGARATTPTSTRTPAPRSASRRSPRPTTCCRTRTPRSRYDAFGPDFRQVPEGVDPRPGHEPAGPRGRGAGRSAGGAGPRRRGVVHQRVRRSRTSTSTTCFGGMFGGGRRRAGGRSAGADQEAELELTVEEAYRGGRRIDHAGRARRAAHATRSTIPAGVTDGQRIRLAGQGGQGTRRRRRRATCTWSCGSRPAPALPGRGPRPPRRPAAHAVGGGPGARRSLSTRPAARPRCRVPAGTSSGRRLRLRGRGHAQPAAAARRPATPRSRIMVPVAR